MRFSLFLVIEVFYRPERTLGLVLISGGYSPPSFFDLDRVLVNFKKVYGYENLGCSKFFELDDAAAIIENNFGGCIDLIFASDPILAKSDFAPAGKARASHMTEDVDTIVRRYLPGGMQPKLNWYNAIIANIDGTDEQNLDSIINVLCTSWKEQKSM